MSANQGNQPRNQNSVSIESLNQRLFVKEQEVTSLKVQNRHLISKLEEADRKAEEQINTQKISDEVHRTLRECFDVIQTTMRGIYLQTQRAESAVEEVKNQVLESRESEQEFFQEKILNQIASFGERIERKISALYLSNENIRAELEALRTGATAKPSKNIEKITEIFAELSEKKREAVNEVKAQEKLLRETQQEQEAQPENKIILDHL